MPDFETQTPEPFDRYGQLWPAGAQDYAVELTCYNRTTPERARILDLPLIDTGHAAVYHFERAMQHLWPEKTVDGRRGFIFSPFTERRVQGWCECDYQTWWGSSAVGKSTDAAAIAMTHFLAAPDRTSISVCSTSTKMLMRRIWSEFVRLYQMYPPGSFPMEYFKGRPAFLFATGSGSQKTISEKSGIFGIAVMRGKVEEAVGNIVGAHNDFNLLTIDEMQATRQAAVEAFDNLSGGGHAKFLGMGNPVSKLDPLGTASKPKRGWNSITTDHERWETERGICLYFDGHKSPGVTDPKRYPFLLSKKQIEDMARSPGVNSPRYWTQRRGFMPPDGIIQTVFSESMLTMGRCQDKDVVWRDDPIRLAAMDESFTIDGDRTIFQTALVGWTKDGLARIHFEETKAIDLELSESVPLEVFVARRVRDFCLEGQIPPKRFGLDVTAQQTAMATIVEKELGRGIFRCQFGGKASERPCSDDDPRPAHEAYHDRVTELWYTMRNFALAGQLSGISDDCGRELCSRLIGDNGIKVWVESKRDMKDRVGMSPDIADAHVILIDMARELLNLTPGHAKISDGTQPASDEEMQRLDVDSSDHAFASDEIPLDAFGGE